MQKVIATIFGLVLLASIFWAGGQANILSEGAAIMAMPWGVVTLLDLYTGFILFSLIIWICEPRKWVAMCWIAPVFVLGNIVPALWLVLRGLPRLLAKA